MKKILFTVLVALALALALSAAQADGKTNPRWQHVHGSPARRSSLPRTRGGASVAIECVRTPTPESPGEFRAVISGGDPDDYVLEFSITDEGRDPYGYVYYGQATQDAVFDSVRLYSTGEYSVWVDLYARDNTDLCLSSDGYFFTVSGPESSSLEYKAAQIVAECRGADDWHTALNLHDWLTHHAYYDNNFEYYGADILYRGLGVCDSYSKAYSLLCETAGITVDRVISDELFHAWNALALDGEWYHADVTWDDPGDDEVPVSGWENREYFCLNDEMMSHMGHACTDASFTIPCTALDANYVVHEGVWRDYGIAYRTDEQGYLIPNADGGYEHDIIAEFAEALDRGDTAVTVSWSMYRDAATGGRYWMSEAGYYCFAYGIGTLDWTVNGSPVAVTARYEWGDDCVTVTAQPVSFPVGGTWGDAEWSLEESGVLTIRGTGSVADFSAGGAQAWQPYSGLIVRAVIEKGIAYIGNNAFSGCTALETVFFKGTPEEWAAVVIGAGNSFLVNAELVCYPPFDASVTLFLPADLESIAEHAFVSVAAEAVVVPRSVLSIADGAFDGSRIAAIYGFEGSAAEAFANAHEDILFIPIDEGWLLEH